MRVATSSNIYIESFGSSASACIVIGLVTVPDPINKTKELGMDGRRMVKPGREGTEEREEKRMSWREEERIGNWRK